MRKTFTILAAAAPPRRERGRAVLKAGESDAGMATKADAEAIVARMTDLRSMVDLLGLIEAALVSPQKKEKKKMFED